jgi:hypothetical protein
MKTFASGMPVLQSVDNQQESRFMLCAATKGPDTSLTGHVSSGS